VSIAMPAVGGRVALRVPVTQGDWQGNAIHLMSCDEHDANCVRSPQRHPWLSLLVLALVHAHMLVYAVSKMVGT
jgi:hypothetical protein